MARVGVLYGLVLCLLVMCLPSAAFCAGKDHPTLGYRLHLPEGWAPMSRAEIFVLNDYFSGVLGNLEQSDLRVRKGYRPESGELKYPLITVSASERERIGENSAGIFNARARELEVMLLESGVFSTAGRRNSIVSSKFDPERWAYTITSTPGGMFIRTRYVYTASGYLVFRAFLDQRSIHYLPEVDRIFSSVSLALWNSYAEAGEPESASETGEGGNVWLVYFMVLLVLIGIGLTSTGADHEDRL